MGPCPARPGPCHGLLAIAPALLALGSRSFFSPDEVYYPQVAREMVERKDWVVPHLDGQPWLNKPPLFPWLAALTSSALGWDFPNAVLLNSLLAGLTAWLIAHYTGKEHPPRGLVAGAAYLTMFLPQAVARTGLTDGLLTLLTTAAQVILLTGPPTGRPSRACCWVWQAS
ncbi:MAG: glycosyltransferase family 39 protein [Thermoanaerobaculum sp.]|nr:glycosyltransferase family 39 protein [Thermoanaerobaculum sp.]